MKEVAILLLTTGLALVGFGLILLLGFVKRNKKLKLYSLFIFIVFVYLGILTTYRIISKSYNRVTAALKPRTGEEIYNALFDKCQSDCVKILNAQDQVIPKIDYAIWLHFRTCPDELNRILLRHEFSKGVFSTEQKDINMPYDTLGNWFDPVVLGDSIRVFEYSSEDKRNVQTLWVSMDSTEVFCRDIFD